MVKVVNHGSDEQIVSSLLSATAAAAASVENDTYRSSRWPTGGEPFPTKTSSMPSASDCSRGHQSVEGQGRQTSTVPSLKFAAPGRSWDLLMHLGLLQISRLGGRPGRKAWLRCLRTGSAARSFRKVSKRNQRPPGRIPGAQQTPEGLWHRSVWCAWHRSFPSRRARRASDRSASPPSLSDVEVLTRTS